MQFSDFGRKFQQPSGIAQLMDDLTDLLASGKQFHMLGGGNPARIEPVLAEYQSCMQSLAADRDRLFAEIGGYGAPGGHHRFTNVLVNLFNDLYGWNLSHRNIALTNGSQNAFFLLFNMFGGSHAGQQGKVMLPMTPEYIGYEDVAVGDSFFVSNRPIIDITGERRFKYRVDFSTLDIDDSIRALCISRPTNPTGNVITNTELDALDQLASAHNIPLIIDNAYGEPFPNIIHTDVSLKWHDNIILSMSLSKLGLPALRTGIVVASEDVIELLTTMNSIINLTPVSIGPSLVEPLFDNRRILELCQDHVQPFYAAKGERALEWFDAAMGDLPAYAHQTEGAIFLWLWFPDLPISCAELYQRLKQRGVLIVPGHHFFPGLNDNWQHRHECIRVSYAMDDNTVREGIRIIGDEVHRAYAQV